MMGYFFIGRSINSRTSLSPKKYCHMKKVFIGLLIVAAGTAFYLLLNKKSNPGNRSIQKDLIIGNWKLDSIYSLKDSGFNAKAGVKGSLAQLLLKYSYEFNADGFIALWPKDSSTTGNGYEWIGKKRLAWKEFPANKTIEVFEVPVLNFDTLALVSNDSIVLSFIKSD
jgi:hypothetical protein